MKKILGLRAVGLFIPAAIASTAIASVALVNPAVALSNPGTSNSANVLGEPYFKAVSILKSQGLKATFGGSFGGDLPQSQCIVDQQKPSRTSMILVLNCTKAAGQQAAADAPAAPAPGVTSGGGTPGAGQGTYGGPIGVPVPVG